MPLIVARYNTIIYHPFIHSLPFSAPCCSSKGYGFVEFEQHIHALAALRQLNNNPQYSAEFAAGGAAVSCVMPGNAGIWLAPDTRSNWPLLQARTLKIRVSCAFHLSLFLPQARGKPTAEQPRLIVEFSIENIAEVKKHEKRKALAQQKAELLAQQRAAQGPQQHQQQPKPRKDKEGNVIRESTSNSKNSSSSAAQSKGGDKGQQQAATKAELATMAQQQQAAAESRKRKREASGEGGESAGVTPSSSVAAPAAASVSDSEPASGGSGSGGKKKLTYRERRDRIKQQKRERKEKAEWFRRRWWQWVGHCCFVGLRRRSTGCSCSSLERRCWWGQEGRPLCV